MRQNTIKINFDSDQLEINDSIRFSNIKEPKKLLMILVELITTIYSDGDGVTLIRIDAGVEHTVEEW